MFIGSWTFRLQKICERRSGVRTIWSKNDLRKDIVELWLLGKVIACEGMWLMIMTSAKAANVRVLSSVTRAFQVCDKMSVSPPQLCPNAINTVCVCVWITGPRCFWVMCGLIYQSRLCCVIYMSASGSCIQNSVSIWGIAIEFVTFYRIVVLW